MRILPVNNYNYQAIPQNNQKQNVNFGMLKGDRLITKRFCEAAGFTSFATRLKDFGVSLQREGCKYISIAKTGKGFRSRTFKTEEVARLINLETLADNKNVIMAPAESTRFLAEVENADPDVVNNDAFFARIEQLIASTDEIKPEDVAELEKLEKIRQAFWDKSAGINTSVPV